MVERGVKVVGRAEVGKTAEVMAEEVRAAEVMAEEVRAAEVEKAAEVMAAQMVKKRSG